MSAQPVVNNFNGMTRRKVLALPPITKPTGGGSVSQVALPRTGYLARIWLAVRGTVAGTITSPNALGFASVINRIRLTLNSGLDIINISGPGYHYLLRQNLDQSGFDPLSQSNARSAFSATSYNLDMVLPIALNLRDPLGMLLLQSESTLVTLSVDWTSDSALASGITTHTCTITPYLEIFTVPASPSDQPPQNVVHQILEEQTAVAATGQFTYVWPRGGIYMALMHGLGIGVSGADNYSRVQIRAAQSDYIQDTDVPYLDMSQQFFWGQSRVKGTIPIDLYGSTGLGIYDIMRDTIDTSRLTDLATVITASATGTLYSVRRQLIVIPG